MKLRVLALAFAFVLAIGAGGVASADSHDTPGTPGTPNCHGQTIAYITHLGVGGVGQVAALLGVPVSTLQDEVTAYCGS